MSMSIRSRCSDETALTLLEGEPPRLELHRTGEVPTLDELLSRRPEGRIVLSAWSDPPRAAAVTERLRRAGLRVAAAYGPGPAADPWLRADLGGEVWEELPPSPPRYAYLPLPDTAEQRVKFPGPFRDGIAFVTIHNTAEPFSARDERARVANRREVRTSFHYVADEREIVQLLPLDRHGWHAGDGEGDGNLRSVGIEICRSVFRGDNAWLYRRAEANAVLLAAALLKVLKLGPAALRMHRDWSGKYCPHRILEAGAWDEFVARVAARLAAPATSALAAEIAAANGGRIAAPGGFST